KSSCHRPSRSCAGRGSPSILMRARTGSGCICAINAGLAIRSQTSK
ncbi:hypothetical protein NGA_2059510, partial [Nannochloropsis gaditana CCMP526]